MSRLTNDIRYQMARKLVAHRYTDEAKAILYNDRKLADEAYNHCYPKALLEHMEAVCEVYPDAMYMMEYIVVNAGGYRATLGCRFSSKWVHVEQTAPASRLLASHRHDITDEKLIERIKEHVEKKKGFDDVCETAYHEAMSVLNTMTSGKKLAGAWPEAIPVIGDLIPEGSRILPVVQVSTINAKFGLPPKTKKESK
jgi:hypothetical protein